MSLYGRNRHKDHFTGFKKLDKEVTFFEIRIGNREADEKD